MDAKERYNAQVEALFPLLRGGILDTEQGQEQYDEICKRIAQERYDALKGQEVDDLPSTQTERQ